MTELTPQAVRAAVFKNMQQEVYDNNIAHGWYDDTRSFGDDIALLHSEVSEAFDAFRRWGFQDMTYSDHDEHHELDGKPEGVGSELADVFIRLLDTCHRSGIDLVAEYERKMAYNRTRPYRHGGKAL